MPFALKDKVAAELDRLQAEGIIAPTKFLQWAAPIVPIVKKAGSIRICGDYKQIINKCAKTEIYLLPRIEELFATSSGGQSFRFITCLFAAGAQGGVSRRGDHQHPQRLV